MTGTFTEAILAVYVLLLSVTALATGLMMPIKSVQITPVAFKLQDLPQSKLLLCVISSLWQMIN